jgi:hypothetical protein
MKYIVPIIIAIVAVVAIATSAVLIYFKVQDAGCLLAVGALLGCAALSSAESASRDTTTICEVVDNVNKIAD